MLDGYTAIFVHTVMCCIMTFWSTTDRIYDGGPIRLYYYNILYGSGSSVGVVTDYGLDGPGSNPSGDEIFCLSRPALEPTQPPVKWVPGLSPGIKCGRGVLLTTHPF